MTDFPHFRNRLHVRCEDLHQSSPLRQSLGSCGYIYPIPQAYALIPIPRFQVKTIYRSNRVYTAIAKGFVALEVFGWHPGYVVRPKEEPESFSQNPYFDE